jgi:hypothetical protein
VETKDVRVAYQANGPSKLHIQIAGASRVLLLAAGNLTLRAIAVFKQGSETHKVREHPHLPISAPSNSRPSADLAWSPKLGYHPKRV